MDAPLGEDPNRRARTASNSPAKNASSSIRGVRHVESGVCQGKGASRQSSETSKTGWRWMIVGSST